MKTTLLFTGIIAAMSGFAQAAISNTDPNFIQAALNKHNLARSYHNSPALTWSATLATFAQTVANNIQSTCTLAHSGGPYGENLFGMCCSTPTAVSSTNDGVSAWYNEIKSYNFDNPGFSASTGHFTQVVWASTQQVGCAWSQAPCGAGWSYLVCEYSPAGNVQGAFAQNVARPTCAIPP